MGLKSLAIIGGSGFYDFPLQNRVDKTIYFDSFDRPPKIIVTEGIYRGIKLLFIPRHGKNHTRYPSLVPFAQNILACKALEYDNIIAVSAVGSMSHDLQPGSVTLPTQIADFTKKRKTSIFPTLWNKSVIHTDFTHPFCKSMSSTAREILGLGENHEAVYFCTEGPRFETAFEIEMFQKLSQPKIGLVGMTAMPEAIFAREVGLCYLNLSVVANLAAGLDNVQRTMEEVQQFVSVGHNKVVSFIDNFIDSYNPSVCECNNFKGEFAAQHHSDNLVSVKF